MEQNKKKYKESEEITDFNLKDFLKICLNKWYWFAICLIFAVGIALFYIYRKQPEYKRYEQILVNNQDSGGGGIGDISNSFSSLGLFSKNSNVYNELLTMTSPAILYQVADSLQLDMNYLERDGLRFKTLYGTNLPFRVDMLDIDRQGNAGFRMKLKPNGDKELFKFVSYSPDGKKIKHKEEISIPASTTEFDSPIGRIKITPNPKYVPGIEEETKEIRVGKMAMQSTVELYGLKLSGDLADDDADVIELTIEDVSVQRAVDILNYVLYVYNSNWVDDKNRMAQATSTFIDERLNVISNELDNADKTIALFRKESGVISVQASTESNLQLGSKLEEKYIEESNELSIAQFMKDFLAQNNNITTVLPVNLGLASVELTNQIIAYNDLLLNRNNIVANSSESNPLAKSYADQLWQLRSSLVRSIDNQISTLQTTLKSTQKEIDKNFALMTNSPEATLPLLAEERQRLVKQNLYIFLLQKKEENELTQKFTADNVRIITPPVGPLKPVSPRKGLIIVVACIIGFGVPLILLYYLETSNNTIRSKKDLDTLTMSFAGEIPQVGGKANLKALKDKIPGKKKMDEKPPLAVVSEGKRDVVNEAFRVIRGNIDFMSGKNAGSQVIMITSFNPGSGKSFIAYNLGASFGLKNRRVLIIDCDLRHGSSSMYVGMPKKGLTEYLTGNTDNWESLVVKAPDAQNLSILPIGKMPPNPAELLEDGRLATLIEEARKDYDIIFLDCPPVNIVVDTQIVSQWADRTLFVVRAGLLERSALKELNEFYEEKKFKNISVILNGTEATRSRYYTYGNYQHLN